MKYLFKVEITNNVAAIFLQRKSGYIVQSKYTSIVNYQSLLDRDIIDSLISNYDNIEYTNDKQAEVYFLQLLRGII
jgi:hypothetical protein